MGIDPGLLHTGWGVIESKGSALNFIACGTVSADSAQPLASRLQMLSRGISEIIALQRPTEAAIEETFATPNGASTLKLGQARGALILTLAQSHLSVAEYAAKVVKKALVGNGNAEKQQLAMMVGMLLPAARDALAASRHDAADALAIAICHAHSRRSA